MKRLLAILLSLSMVLSIIPFTFAASDEATNAANALYELGLFSGTGTDANGNPIFELDRAPTRHEAITMLVRLLGKESEAKAGSWTTPFTDVADWAKPYVGYAYANGLASGTSTTTYGGNDTITASQYITFVLRALGYSSGTDFQWDRAWELSDRIGLTDGRYNASTTNFTRGDVAIISYHSISISHKNNENPYTIENIQGIWRCDDERANEEFIFSGTDFTRAVIAKDRNDGSIRYYSMSNGSYNLWEGTLALDTRNMTTYDLQTSDPVNETTFSDSPVWEIKLAFENENTFTCLGSKYYRSSDNVVMPKVREQISIAQANPPTSQTTSSDTQRVKIAEKIASAANNAADGLQISLSAASCYTNKIISTGSTYQRYNEAEKRYLLAAEMSYFQVKANVSDIKSIASEINNQEIISRCDRIIEIVDQLSAIEEMNPSAMAMCTSYSQELVTLLTQIAELAGTTG